jgi:hypothetical protein
MSRSHLRHGRYHNRGTDDAVFVVIILLACAVWAHKAVMLRVEHYAIAACITVISIVSLGMLFKILMATMSRARYHNPDIDIITSNPTYTLLVKGRCHDY